MILGRNAQSNDSKPNLTKDTAFPSAGHLLYMYIFIYGTHNVTSWIPPLCDLRCDAART